MAVKIDNVRIVLVETSHPGNIGATARAMKNMTLTDLAIVSPRKYSEADGEGKGKGKAYARASGATDVLYAATQYDSLSAAIADCDLVIGASARLRAITWPELNPREMAEKILSVQTESSVNNENSQAIYKKAAIVFGREDSGLTNDEMDLCQYLVHIPANADYTSLNIAAAVQVLCYELHMTALLNEGRIAKAPNDHPMASSQEIEYFYEHLEQSLVDMNFLNRDNPMQLMRRLRKLFNRSGLDKIEVNILRGILTAASRGFNKSE